jgi:hypothetical protein
LNFKVWICNPIHGIYEKIGPDIFKYEDWTSYFDFVLLCKKRFYELMKKTSAIHNKKTNPLRTLFPLPTFDCKEKPLAACLLVSSPKSRDCKKKKLLCNQRIV